MWIASHMQDLYLCNVADGPNTEKKRCEIRNFIPMHTGIFCSYTMFCGQWNTFLYQNMYRSSITYSSKYPRYLSSSFANDQLDALFISLFITPLYMFRASQCSSSGVTAWYAGPSRHTNQSLTETNHTR